MLLYEAADADELVSAYSAVFETVIPARCDASLALADSAGIIAWHSEVEWEADESQIWDEVKELLTEQLKAGKTIVASGSGACRLGKYFIGGENGPSTLRAGMNVLPDCVLVTNFESSDRARTLSVLAARPGNVGIGLDAGSTLMLDGRKVRVGGRGKATFLLVANEQQPLRVESIEPQGSPRQRPIEYLVDLTEWRRDALDRTLEPFPSPRQTPVVDRGRLVIVGGGGMPAGLMEQFVEFAGGIETARLVYVPCSEEDEVSKRQSIVEAWRDMGVEQSTFIHTKDRIRANEDEQFLRPLRTATGIWFGGGRQWNLADSYYGTTAHKLMKEVLRRGGAIGGSSAGASIQARYLARATPIENIRIMAPGYERGGLGFISGVAIDQHFTQRGRHPDMTLLVNRYPQLLGIGIDETTALIVEKSHARVVGEGKVHFFDRSQTDDADRPPIISLGANQVYDLAAREIVSP